MATTDEQMDTENNESPKSVEDISSDSESSPININDGTIAHKEIKNCHDEEEESSNFGNNDSIAIVANEPASNVSNIENYNAGTINYGDKESLEEDDDESLEERRILDDSDSAEHESVGSVEDKEINFAGDNTKITSPISPQHSDSDHEDNASDEEIFNDDVDAPVPSPFSDIGDIGDISGPENAMISDILKETSNAEHISPVLDSFAENLDAMNATLHNETNNDSSDVGKHDGNKEAAGDIGDKGNDGNDAGDDDGDGDGGDGDDDDDDDDKPSQAENDSEPQPSADDVEHKDLAKNDKPAETQEQRGYVGGLIADIFGDSDEEDEDEEFKGFHEEELQRERLKLSVRSDVQYDKEEGKDDSNEGAKDNSRLDAEEEADDDEEESGMLEEPDDDIISDKKSHFEREKPVMVSDFDLMMQRKKQAMGQRRRRKSDSEVLNDSDDIIAAMILSMHDAVEEDRMLNQAGRAATKKLKMLDSVVSHLHKADLQRKFIDGGVLPIMKEWLSPLPDNSLPHIMIRKQFLRLLSEFPPLNAGALKMSGIGRAVMLLCKHPKETRENRNLAGRIVSQWARPIFGVQTTFKDITKEEREERDKCNAAEFKKRRLSSTDDSFGSGAQEDKRPKRPGDKGFIARARVPKPSNRDYVIRPRSDISLGEIGSMKNPKKSLDRFEKQMRKYKERKGLKGAASRAVSISLNGSKMSL